MATTTTNLSLRKPEGTDFVTVSLDIAGNMQTLDDKWAVSTPTSIAAALAAGSALTVARSDHAHNVASGTVGAPGLPIGESNSGFYRIGASNIGATIAGALSWAFSATGIAIETALSLKHIATPAAPSAGYLKLYAKSDNLLYRQTPAGSESLVAGPVKIDEKSGTGASGVIEFSSIPSTYRSLMLTYVGRTDAAVTATSVVLTFETSPTAGAYNHQFVRGNGATANANENAGTADSITVGSVTGTSGSANAACSATIWIPEYAQTNFYKTVQSQAMAVTTLGASGLFSDQFVGLWESTVAIDRIRLTVGSGNWTTTSRVTLYGIPG